MNSTAHLWDAATGTRIGPSILHDEPPNNVYYAQFAPDQTHLVTVNANSVRLWDIGWAVRDSASLESGICAEKLLGSEDTHKDTVSGREYRKGVRYVDVTDVSAAPILYGREGEDVCAISIAKSAKASLQTFVLDAWLALKSGETNVRNILTGMISNMRMWTVGLFTHARS
jgi:WD40 repeat protein